MVSYEKKLSDPRSILYLCYYREDPSLNRRKMWIRGVILMSTWVGQSGFIQFNFSLKNRKPKNNITSNVKNSILSLPEQLARYYCTCFSCHPFWVLKVCVVWNLIFSWKFSLTCSSAPLQISAAASSTLKGQNLPPEDMLANLNHQVHKVASSIRKPQLDLMPLKRNFIWKSASCSSHLHENNNDLHNSWCLETRSSCHEFAICLLIQKA